MFGPEKNFYEGISDEDSLTIVCGTFKSSFNTNYKIKGNILVLKGTLIKFRSFNFTLKKL